MDCFDVFVRWDYSVQFLDNIKIFIDTFEVSISAGKPVCDNHFESCDCFNLFYIDHGFAITCQYIFGVLFKDVFDVFSLALDNGIVLIIRLKI
jgi:hypothetical protein